MTEFKQELGHYCRNPKCRSKLPEPVANEREAFCARGCHSGFYRKRCLVCEAPMERRTERQLVMWQTQVPQRFAGWFLASAATHIRACLRSAASIRSS